MGTSMNANGKRLPPPDISKFHENRNGFPREELLRHAGQFVAWSPDGLHILASGESEQVVEEKLVALGIDPSQVVGENMPPSDVVLFC
jgi:hypothetical protein